VAIITGASHRPLTGGRTGRSRVRAPEALADNTTHHPTTSGRHHGEYNNQHNSHISTTFWSTAYLTINETNYVIDGVDIVEAPEETRNRLRGEALFQRAFAYFDLARTYGYEPGREVNGWDQSVIIRTEPTRDVSDADLRPRATNQEVYDLVVSDLEEAVELLAADDRGVYFANHTAALSLLARVHLYLENWQEAADLATQAMDASDVGLVDQDTYAGNIFESHPNPESILEISIDPEAETLGSNDAPEQILTPSGWFDVLVSDLLLALYEEDDVRLSLYDQHEGFDYILKYTASRGTHTDNVPLIRYPELLLIRAEARAELGQTAEAVDDLNTLREARGASTFASGDPQEIIAEVYDERRRELAFEGGHRWYDLKRRNMDVHKPDGLPTVSWDDYRILAPIPTAQVDNSPEIDQNPGY
jgi:starch-binding outer membrane protein, SusD/RagB family